MLILKNISKEYTVGDTTVKALKGVSVEFRENEFVSILGPSGCGKTTMLNIIGGLDRYTSGDLSINGVSTKKFSDRDLDTYRNNSVGFVFQSYNLIPHQTVLANVELALPLSGVSKAERRERAIAVLNKVGLGDQLHKKPNQMSGGQMQRVAIARALVNDPDILLADEPTGALDSETSVQIMEILKEISKDKLIIMVTHNQEIAMEYSTRIIKLLDGNIIDDSNPYHVIVEKHPTPKEGRRKKEKKSSMKYLTALSLSLNNLMTKKTRTILTSFAGSIGIIGIALIMALSSGVQAYINRVEEDTLSSYPLTIEQTAVGVDDLLSNTMGKVNGEIDHDLDKIYSSDIMGKMINTMLSEMIHNDMQAFKAYLEDDGNDIAGLVNDIQYGYSTVMNIYKADTSQGIVKVNPSNVLEKIGFSSMTGPSAMSSGMPSSGFNNMNVWKELMGNETLLASQYDVLAGQMPQNYNEVVLIVDKNNEINDYTLYSLGLKDVEELTQFAKDIMEGKEVESQQVSYTYEELLALKFKLLLNTDYYEKAGNGWVDRSNNEAYMKEVLENALDVKVVGILRPKDDAVAISVSGSVGYTSDLMTHLINTLNDSEIVKAQKENPETDVFTGIPFSTDVSQTQEMPFDISSLSDEEKAYLASLSEEERLAFMEKYSKPVTSSATYDGNLSILGVADLDNPSTINIYPKDFESKELIIDKIDAYNQKMTDEGKEGNVIHYTDYVGLIMSSVTTIINVISYILIAFVAISLVVSSIMIGIITYISVLERTKEIGILRSIGASKKDISRVFNAETLIVGFVSGALGIGITLFLIIPINMIIESITAISGIAVLPTVGAIALVLISMALNFIAGLIPSKIAAKKDPVVALRTE